MSQVKQQFIKILRKGGFIHKIRNIYCFFRVGCNLGLRLIAGMVQIVNLMPLFVKSKENVVYLNNQDPLKKLEIHDS